MAEQHLEDLEHALAQRGWHATDVMDPPGALRWGISGTWEITRGDQRLVLDFDGGDADGRITYPIERAYACHVREHEDLSIYFGKRSARSWRDDLTSFAASLDAVGRV